MAEYSPMMQRYLETKEEYKDCILFYRLGDFYEMFFDDAITVSRELELTLTGKDCGQAERAPMCGVPHHAAEIYISKLIAKGYKVAICEQLEDPKTAKGIVKRGVIRVVTPGTVIESNMLEEKKNNYIMSIVKKGIYYGIAVCDVTTGDFYSTEIKENNNFPLVLDEIARYSPAELVVNSMMYDSKEEIGKIKERFEIYFTRFNDKFFSEDINTIVENYNLVDNDDNPIKDIDKRLFSVASINALVEYLKQTQKTSLEHINKIIMYNTTRYMSLDINARRNLELTEKMRDKSKKGTLLWVLDKTSTSMGGRHLRRWINDPLIDVNEINKRLNAVKELKENVMLRGDIIESLKKVYDIERLAGKSVNDFERLNKLSIFANQYRVHIVLKGAHSVIATPDRRLFFNMSGNPGMAKGGAGGVLTGVLLALVAKKLNLLDLLRIGVFAHGLAGDCVAEKEGRRGCCAGMIAERMGEAWKRLEK